MILRKAQPDSDVTALLGEEQQNLNNLNCLIIAKGLADSLSDYAITRHLKNSPQCLNIVCSSKVLDHFSVLASARDHSRLDRSCFFAVCLKKKYNY